MPQVSRSVTLHVDRQRNLTRASRGTPASGAPLKLQVTFFQLEIFNPHDCQITPLCESGNQEFTSQYLETQVISASLTGRDIVFPHEGVEVGSEQTHLFGRPGDIPVVSFQGLEEEGVLDFI